MKIGVLGLGTIAEPMVRSLLRRFSEIRVTVSPRSTAIAQKLSQEFTQVVTASDNQQVVDDSDVILLCMLANVARQELPTLQFKEHQKIVSVMVDYSVDQLLVDCAPAKNISMTVPLPFIETGDCPLPVYPHGDVVAWLYGDDNIIVTLPDENSMAPFLAATGLMATMMNQFDKITRWLSLCGNDSVAAEKYILKLASGYLNALPQDGRGQFSAALKDLSTEGGLNAQLLNKMIDAGYFEDLTEGLTELNQRLGFVPD